MTGDGAQWVLLSAALIAAGLAGVRWLRVAQREHYLAGSVVRFARRWWSIGPNRLLGAAAVIGVAGAASGITLSGLVAAAVVAVGPFGLTLRGRTSPLTWTRRLNVLATTAAALALALVAIGALGGLAVAAATAVLVAVAAPAVLDVALVLTGPLERRLGRRFVRLAQARLAAVAPMIVAITGSYGKTGTKGYVAHLLSGTVTVVPTPKSYNNQSGLARAVNERLLPGTDVFVAEMGTYGPGEISEMCSWVRPDIAVITAIGPVHLERMRTEDRVAQAKAEILERASVAVLNIDDPRLANLAERIEPTVTRLWRCSAVDRRADVCVVHDDGSLRVFLKVGTLSRQIARIGGLDAPPTNVAVAVAVALQVGVRPEAMAKRLPGLPTADHRRQVTVGRRGATVIDDTYNANPAGAASVLRLFARLAEEADSRRRIVVTPGMVELGRRQAEENSRFAAAAAAVATDLVVVGQTNARALVSGCLGATVTVRRAPTRELAVAWVATQLEPGDIVLYENDLPDHYP